MCTWKMTLHKVTLQHDSSVFLELPTVYTASHLYSVLRGWCYTVFQRLLEIASCQYFRNIIVEERSEI